MRSSRLWEKVTLGLGVICVVVVALGLGYKVGDYALNALREIRPARTDVLPKPPALVKGQSVNAAPAAAEAKADSSRMLFRVQVSVSTKDAADEVVSKLAETGYDSYIIPGGRAVQVGAFERRDQAELVAQRLSSIGVKADIR